MHATIEQVRHGPVRAYGEGRRAWTSAIAKAPTTAAVAVGELGLDGDAQADLKHHGGPDKAVLAYSVTRYPAWRDAHGLDLAVGTFGENLSVRGHDEDDVCIGDTYAVGALVLQVTQPRRPCWKLSARWGIPELTDLTERSGWTGWYLRVLEPGPVEAGDTLALVERPHPTWTVMRASRTVQGGSRQDRLTLAELPELAAAWPAMLRARADRDERGAVRGDDVDRSEDARLGGAPSR